MNFLIFDPELSSINLIKTLIDDFHHVTLITRNSSSSSNNFENSPFLSIQSGDISNASEVLQLFSRHENDPFDSILIFNLTSNAGLTNINETIQRLKRSSPTILFFYVNRIFEPNGNFEKILKDSSSIFNWIVVVVPQIDRSIETKYRIEKSMKNSTNSISSAAIVEFIQNQLKDQKDKHQILFLF